ncbi:Disease resistance protein RPS5 [Rhynchospora pubera]|uniref:Disease resistance protein RPS5 n=1 Tax=Rhynchospora pubera TaxID=906938 RepID=A0AAV8F8F8_9POAL|nr:Disease resistance protein RPS5 [Rhynchospora pubera]
MEQKQGTIYNFLREKSFVLLLDDLWDRVDLDTVGVPNPMELHTCKRKVVLTTRSKEVCRKMEVMKRIKVDILDWEDAWSLFIEKVTKETIDSDPLIKKHAMDVVKELGGLPLALITTGRAMRDKTDHYDWEEAIMQLKQARLDDVESSSGNKSVFHTFKFSYDNLKNDTLRQCFLHCSLWPEDFSIRKDRLIELWMGSGLIDKPEIQAAYTIGYAYINDLISVCLLETDNDYAVKMHDVIRDMALWIANNRGVDTNKWINVSAGTHNELREIDVFDNTEKLFVMNNYTGIVSFSIKSSSTKLTTLLINHNSVNDTKLLRLELFSELTMLDLSYSNLRAFPVEICKLVHLQFLNLSGNYHATMNVPEELVALINLRYFLLRETDCTFPESVLSKLKSLRMLDLIKYYMEDDFEMFPMLEEDLKGLPQFQALGITISIHGMPEFGKLSQISVPVRWLVVSKYKESSLSISSCFLGNPRLQRYLFTFGIRDSDDVRCVNFESTSENQSICHLERLQSLSFSWMKNMKEVIWRNLNPKDVFPRLQFLEFASCHQLQSISWVVNLPRTRELTIIDCIHMKQLVCVDELNDNGINTNQHSFPLLKTLYLSSNGDLEIISDPMITFPALEFLDVFKCAKLKKLPFEHSNTQRKLKLIRGSEEWWNNIEMEDVSQRSLLQPFFKKWK